MKNKPTPNRKDNTDKTTTRYKSSTNNKTTQKSIPNSKKSRILSKKTLQNRSALLINLGTPKTPTVANVRRYLREFLMDKYVIDIPYIFRLLLVGGIIAPIRSFISSKSYKEIWLENGLSPLLDETLKLQKSCQTKTPYPVSIAMRYSSPSIEDGLKTALEKLPNTEDGAVGEIYCIPLYPQYAMSTTKTVEEKTAEVFRSLKKKNKKIRNITLLFKKPFFQDIAYQKALAASIAPYAKKLGKKNGYDKLIFSYHGIPVRHLKKTDPSKVHCYSVDNCCQHENPTVHATCYRHQCLATSMAVCKILKIKQSQTLTTFQSRLGTDPWLEPFTDITMKGLPKKKIKRVAVCSPAFVSDNLETLFELRIENREFFEDAGGEVFDVIPCLNANNQWAEVLSSWITDRA